MREVAAISRSTLTMSVGNQLAFASRLAVTAARRSSRVSLNTHGCGNAPCLPARGNEIGVARRNAPYSCYHRTAKPWTLILLPTRVGHPVVHGIRQEGERKLLRITEYGGDTHGASKDSMAAVPLAPAWERQHCSNRLPSPQRGRG